MAFVDHLAEGEAAEGAALPAAVRLERLDQLPQLAFLRLRRPGVMLVPAARPTQAIAAHESPKTTKLYDRTQDQVTLDEIACIRF